jgi:hypothetical protein
MQISWARVALTGAWTRWRPARPKAVRWALARIRERPAYAQLRERTARSNG